MILSWIQESLPADSTGMRARLWWYERVFIAITSLAIVVRTVASL